MNELLLEMRSQMDTIKPLVKLWMNWMKFIFVLSIPFSFKYKPAIWVLFVGSLTLPMALIIFSLTGTVHLLGIGHWLTWFPLSLYIYKTQIKDKSIEGSKLYLIWIYSLFITIIICLIFDIWDFINVYLGNK